MASKIADLKKFKGKEGFHFREDSKGNLTDVTLPHNYTLIYKKISSGLLRKIEFEDDCGNYYLYEN